MDPYYITDLAHSSQQSLTPSAPTPHCDNIYAEAYFMYSIYLWYQRRKAKSAIKKKLKVVVNLSNTIQDENNKLQDMKDAWVPFRQIFDQRLLIGNLCCQQYQAIKELEHEESFYPEEKQNRFFYFKDKPIYYP